MKVELVLFVILMSVSLFSQDIPKNGGKYVNDFANAISDEDESILSHMVYNYEKETSIEVAVVTIDDLQGFTKEQYATELFNSWGIGKKQTDSGILLLLSLDLSDRGCRIEVGYGLEEFLTDAQSRNVLQQNLETFKNAEYGKALIDVLGGITTVIGYKSKEARQQYLDELKREKEIATQKALDILYMILICIAICIFLYTIVYFIRKLVRAVKKKDEEKMRTVVQLDSTKVELDNLLKLVKVLDSKNFHGANITLKRINDAIQIDMPNFEKAAKSIKTINGNIDLQRKIQYFENDMKDVANKLESNHSLMLEITTSLDKLIEVKERAFNKVLPDARKLIDDINKNNPSVIWRGFNYIHFDRDVETFISKAKNYFKNANKELENYNYDVAKEHVKGVHISLANVETAINNIFDVDRQIKQSKEFFNLNHKKISNLYDKAKSSVTRSNVNSSTRNLVGKAEKNMTELQSASNVKMVDWILLGSLVKNILDLLNKAIVQSDSDIDDHEEELRRKKQQDEDDDRRRRNNYNDSSSSSSSGGSFGGGRSGGGGASISF